MLARASDVSPSKDADDHVAVWVSVAEMAHCPKRGIADGHGAGSVADTHRPLDLSRPRRCGRDRLNAAQSRARRRIVIAAAFGGGGAGRGMDPLVFFLPW